MKFTEMKRGAVWAAVSLLFFSSCRDKNGEYDASGVFEATEVIVSAQGTGELVELNIEEGCEVTAGSQLGCIDTVQLYLKKSSYWPIRFRSRVVVMIYRGRSLPCNSRLPHRRKNRRGLKIW